MMKKKELIINCIENIGAYIDYENLENEDFSEFFEDSLTFISFIVELEKNFNIEIPDDMLLMDNFRSLKQVEVIINGLINN